MSQGHNVTRSEVRKELLVATRNKKKLEEIKEILKGLNLKIISLIDYPEIPDIIENGSTFKDNAVKKAVLVAKLTEKLTLGEDSGLCVDALGGRPGVYSARFSGRDKSDPKNNLKLLKLLNGLPLNKRKAYYICAVALADENGLIGITQGKCCGFIGFKLKGNFGFGYDPLFVIPEYKKTFAQLGPGIKHRISHRYRALFKARKIILDYFEIKHK
jgi:XTP/dITP diphosphohydrolase